MSTYSQDDVPAAEADDLGDTQARLNGERKEGSISRAQPTRGVRCCEQGVDLYLVQKVDRSFLVSFAGHGQDALALMSTGGLAQGDVAEEGVKSCQAGVSRASAVAPFSLQVVEKLCEKGSIQILNVKVGGILAKPLLRKGQEEAKRIAV